MCIRDRFDVTNNVFFPILDVAKHASIPACPPPTTMTSYIFPHTPLICFILAQNIHIIKLNYSYILNR